MSNKELYDIEKRYLSDVQSNFDKLLNSLKNTKFKLNNDNLNQILLINKLVDELNYNLLDLDNQIINRIPSKQRSIDIKNRIKEYDDHAKLVKKYLPLMIAENFMSQ